MKELELIKTRNEEKPQMSGEKEETLLTRIESAFPYGHAFILLDEASPICYAQSTDTNNLTTECTVWTISLG